MTEHEPDAIDVIKAVILRRGITQKAAAKLCGIDRDTVSAILCRKRRLSIGTASRFHMGLNIPAEILLQPTRDRNGQFFNLHWSKGKAGQHFKGNRGRFVRSNG